MVGDLFASLVVVTGIRRRFPAMVSVFPGFDFPALVLDQRRNKDIVLGLEMGTTSSTTFDPLVPCSVLRFNRSQYTFHSILDFAVILMS